MFAFFSRISKFVIPKYFYIQKGSPGLKSYNYLLNLKFRYQFSFNLHNIADRL
jgi:hypothetical protein